MLTSCICVTGSSIFADGLDRKPLTDKCPTGYHSIQIEQTKSAEAKPGGIGGGMSRTEKFEVCRPVVNSNLKEFPNKKR